MIGSRWRASCCKPPPNCRNDLAVGAKIDRSVRTEVRDAAGDTRWRPHKLRIIRLVVDIQAPASRAQDGRRQSPRLRLGQVPRQAARTKAVADATGGNEQAVRPRLAAISRECQRRTLPGGAQQLL